MPTIGYMPFEITFRNGDTTRTTVVECIDIDSAAIAAVSLATDVEAVVQVRDVSYDEAEVIMSEEPSRGRYRIEVEGDVAYADSIEASLLAANTLVEDGVGEETDRRASATIYRNDVRTIYLTALARRGCRSVFEFERQELSALREQQ